MYRCDWLAATLAASLTLASLPVAAQQIAPMPRNFPDNALRGVITFGTPPAVLLNGDEALLGAGVRIRNTDNLIVRTGDYAGSKAVVNYTVDFQGLLREVWILRPEEIANKPWPRTAEEAARWRFDPTTQTWTKP